MFISGGASGADQAWSSRLRENQVKMKVMSFPGHRRYVNPTDEIVELTSSQLEEAVPHIARAAQAKRCSPSTSVYVKRDWWIIKDVDAVVAVGKIHNGQVEGGTGWTWQMYLGKDPILLAWIYDQLTQQWFSWIGEWVPVAKPPPLSSLGTVALIGTRDLSGPGRRAIQEVEV
jgi:hypothetical protein